MYLPEKCPFTTLKNMPHFMRMGRDNEGNREECAHDQSHLWWQHSRMIL